MRLPLLPGLLGMLLPLLASCSFTKQVVPNPAFVHTEESVPARRTPSGRKLFVFLDGTSNDWKARTNVRRLFELVAAQEDPRRLCIWVEGVGTKGIFGRGLGLGMASRVMAGYEFLSVNYRPGDEIYVFGFSRGALEARSLCGVLAHCGLYQSAGGRVPTDEIWDFCRHCEEEPVQNAASIAKTLAASAAAIDRSKLARGGSFRHDVRVKFLGLWDTVPGLQFTKFNQEGAETDGGRVTIMPRYKVRPYPTIDRIAQALSMNEVRSQFAPLLVGPPLDTAKTKVFEVWFPGVHSDIGGGYADSNELAGVSLEWMLRLLGPDEVIPGNYRVAGSPYGIRHHSELDFWGDFGSKPIQRILPKGSYVHESFLARVNARTPLRESFDSGAPKLTWYRPELKVDVSQSVAQPKYEQLTWEKRGTDEAGWIFPRREFEAHLKIVTTEQAKAKPTTGAPLAPAAAQVKTVAAKPVSPAAPAKPGVPVPVAPTPAPKARGA